MTTVIEGRQTWVGTAGLPGVPVGDGRAAAPAKERRSLDRAADEEMMSRALALAERAALLGEVPVAAVLVRNGRVLAESANRTRTNVDPTAHAEVVTIREAAKRRGDWRLDDTTLYVTLEPCAMCAGAIVLARIPRVVFGASDPKSGMAGSLGNLLRDRRLNHRCDVTGGVLADRSSKLLRSFFSERRV